MRTLFLMLILCMSGIAEAQPTQSTSLCNSMREMTLSIGTNRDRGNSYDNVKKMIIYEMVLPHELRVWTLNVAEIVYTNPNKTTVDLANAIYSQCLRLKVM